MLQENQVMIQLQAHQVQRQRPLANRLSQIIIHGREQVLTMIQLREEILGP